MKSVRFNSAECGTIRISKFQTISNVQKYNVQNRLALLSFEIVSDLELCALNFPDRACLDLGVLDG
jgi:hypothetical protein